MATTNALSRTNLKIRINLINFKWLCALKKPRTKENGKLVQMFSGERTVTERRVLGMLNPLPLSGSLGLVFSSTVLQERNLSVTSEKSRAGIKKT